MKILKYFKDKLVFLAMNLIIFILISLYLIFLKKGFVLIGILFCVWFAPLIIYMIIDSFRYKKYFREMNEILNSLDKKYLLPEVIREQNFVVLDEMNEIFKIIGRDMHEHIKCYKDMQENYREYIETWVHEIKTPIASSKLIIDNNNNEITRKIDHQLNKIENFVEQVLYYSRSNEIYKDYLIKEVNLLKVVQNVIRRNYRDFIGKKISVEILDIDRNVYSDTKWIEFILNQIIGNSIKYIKETGSKIKIYLKENSDQIILTIEDNGIGIPSKDVRRVFEKGFTGENGRKFTKSTGMGLYLCYKLCKKLGLGINLESEENVGTKVNMIFPINEL